MRIVGIDRERVELARRARTDAARIRALQWVAALALFMLTGCSCTDPCNAALCGPCPPALSLTIVGVEGLTPTVSGDVALACTTSGATTSCASQDDVDPGTYVFTVTVPGYAPAEATLVVGPGGSGCCACSVQGDSETIELGARDGGAAMDAGADASRAGDASSDASVGCRPERVEFPMGGDLSPGTLCDDLYVCVADAEAAARVEAASSAFACESEPSGDCPPGGVRCAYQNPGGPGTLDEQEIQAICAITILEPAPDRILCRVYL